MIRALRDGFKGAEWIAVLPCRELRGVDVYVSSIVNKIPAIDLEPRSRVKERHGGKRRKRRDSRLCAVPS
jgi:hypothetical protein